MFRIFALRDTAATELKYVVMLLAYGNINEPNPQ